MSDDEKEDPRSVLKGWRTKYSCFEKGSPDCRFGVVNEQNVNIELSKVISIIDDQRKEGYKGNPLLEDIRADWKAIDSFLSIETNSVRATKSENFEPQ